MPISHQATAELIDSMADGSRELSTLLTATEREREALVSAEHSQFAVCAEEKQEALAGFLRRQQRIIDALERAGRELGLTAGEITMSAIRESVPEPPRERLAALASEIGERLAKLRAANAVNAELLKNALAYYGFLADLIIEALTTRPPYGPRCSPGRGEGPQPIMMDSKA
jgi:flagellar biosynthesis/type III secretory pathway chaperone